MSAKNYYTNAAKTTLIKTIANTAGCAVVAGSSVIAAAVTVPMTVITGLAAASLAVAGNYLHDADSEEHTNVANYSLETSKYAATIGVHAFTAARPVLFSVGYKLGAKSTELALQAVDLALAGMYNSAVGAHNIGSKLYNSSFPKLSNLLKVL